MTDQESQAAHMARERDGKTQAEKFAEAVRESDAKDDVDAFDRALKKIASSPPQKRKRQVVHASDCATGNAPAFEAGACDCGAEDDPTAER